MRSVQVHDEPVERAEAGQRVALNLAGIAVRDVARGDALAAPGALEPTRVLDCDLALRGARHGMRAQVHHGTREAPARLAELGGGLWQARLERTLLARAGDPSWSARSPRPTRWAAESSSIRPHAATAVAPT